MSRSLKLSPVQREVLVVLEEAGEENIPTVLNTLQAAFPDRSHEALVAEAEAAVRGLWRLELIAFSRDEGAGGVCSVALDEAESRRALSLGQEVEYQGDAGTWTWRTGREARPLTLVLTGEGRAALTS